MWAGWVPFLSCPCGAVGPFRGAPSWVRAHAVCFVGNDEDRVVFVFNFACACFRLVRVAKGVRSDLGEREQFRGKCVVFGVRVRSLLSPCNDFVAVCERLG